VGETGSFTVKTTEKNGCSQSSDAVSISISSGAVLMNPLPENSGPACPGETVILSVQQDPNAKSYQWSGPNGFSSSLNTPDIVDFSPEKAGRYVVKVLNSSGCISTYDTTIVESKVLPSVSISGSTAMCEGESIVLEAGRYSGYQLNYQWLKNGSNINGKTTHLLTVTETGNYQVKYNEATCTGTTNSITVNSIPLPAASFSTVEKICKGKYIQFQNTSTVDNNLVPEFIWSFGDGSEQSYQVNPVKVYQTAGTFQVNLAVKYKNTACTDIATQNVLILNPPLISITANKDNIICPGDSLELSLDKNGFNTYLWSNNQTSPAIKVKAPGSYSVKVTTEEQCEASSSVFEVFNHEIVPLEINTENGDSIFSINTTIKLLPNQILKDYLWRPEIGMSNPQMASPEVLLKDSITYTLTGSDLNNCPLKDKIKLYVIKPNQILLEADPLFSPENPENPFWEIKEILSYQENELTIFNRQGLKVFEARPYLNNWNGLYKGALLPEGVYYYVLKLNQVDNYQSGNILLVR
jgi:gliding motility-associated-like protein